MEGGIPQRRIDLSIGDLYHPFYQCLILRTISPGGKNGGLVVIGKVSEVLVENRFEAITLGHRTLKIIGNDCLRNPSKEAKRTFTAADKVFLYLTPRGFDVSVLTASQSGNKDFYFLYFSGIRVDQL